jgi:hypothetical protein
VGEVSQKTVIARDLSDRKKLKVERFLHKGGEIPTQRWRDSYTKWRDSYNNPQTTPEKIELEISPHESNNEFLKTLTYKTYVIK